MTTALGKKVIICWELNGKFRVEKFEFTINGVVPYAPEPIIRFDNKESFFKYLSKNNLSLGVNSEAYND